MQVFFLVPASCLLGCKYGFSISLLYHQVEGSERDIFETKKTLIESVRHDKRQVYKSHSILTRLQWYTESIRVFFVDDISGKSLL